MNIPKDFQLAGIPITLEHGKLPAPEGCIKAGEARYVEQQIIIDLESGKKEMTEECFWHEATHWILYIANEDEKRNDEAFVDRFAHLLYQMVKTAGFELPKHRRLDATQGKEVLAEEG